MIFNFLADHLFSKLRCCSEVLNDRGYKEACHLKLNTNMIKHKQDFPSDLSEFALQNGSNFHEMKTLNPWLTKQNLLVGEGQSYEIYFPNTVVE